MNTPLPSRECILQVLKEEGGPVDAELRRAAGHPRRRADVFQRRIAAMERDGQMMLQPQAPACVCRTSST